MTTLSVIIVNYNVKHFLEQCLLSVNKAIEGIEAEVFVVDNTSVDGSQQMVREKFPWVHLIDNPENVGFSKANNQAIRISKGEYVLLLNPDTVVEESTFHKCLDFMRDHPDAGAMGVKMIDGEGKFLPESKRALPTPWVAFYKIFGLSSLFPKSKTFGKYHLSYLNKEEDHEVEVLSGAFMLMRKQCLDEIGLLDESFFMYGEDVDLSYRVNLGGWKNYYFSGTQIIHYKGESTKKGSLNYVRVFYNAMIIFAQKHFSQGRARSYIFLIRMAVWFRAILAVVTRVVKALAFPVVEGGLIYGAILGIKKYWEYVHKLPKDDIPYPPEFDYIAAPVYTLVFVLLLWLLGAYRKPFKLRPIVVASFAGFVAIATVSFFYPHINFSRAIVGLASIATVIIASLDRAVLNKLRDGNFIFNEPPKRRVVICGDLEEASRIQNLITKDLDYPVTVEGIVTTHALTDESEADKLHVLGRFSQLAEIVSIYRVDEIIFSNKSMPAEQIIETMSQIAREHLQYKIVPPDVNYLIGPHVIHTAMYNSQLFFNIEKRELKWKKRLFDMVSSGFLLWFYPLTFWLYRKPGLAFKNLWNVLRGEYHLVGYIKAEPPGLPPLKKGILNMLHRVQNQHPERKEEHSQGLDRHYARAYSLELDLEILFKGIRQLGG